MSGQGAIAHEAVLGGGHVTTWIAVRGHPVDERITALMNDLHSSSTRMHIELEKLVRDHTIHQQVVLLGTGLDTTAWHLAFPPGVAWWIKQLQQTWQTLTGRCTKEVWLAGAFAYNLGGRRPSELRGTYCCCSVTEESCSDVCSGEFPDCYSLYNSIYRLRTARGSYNGIRPAAYSDGSYETLPSNALAHFQQYNRKIQHTVDLLKQGREMGGRLQPFVDEPDSLDECEAAIDYKAMVCSTETFSSVEK
ncbi:hypothetical protein WJX77_002186 [Trebouxia sp. C0004]